MYYWDTQAFFHSHKKDRTLCSGGHQHKFHCGSEKLKDVQRLKQSSQAQRVSEIGHAI